MSKLFSRLATRNVRVAFVVALAYLALIFYMGSTSRPVVTIPMTAQDKLGHALAFGVMQWTHAFALEALFPGVQFWRLRWFAVLSASVMGGLLEVWQAFLPTRTPEFLDLVADATGAVVFSFFYTKTRLRSAAESVKPLGAVKLDS